MIGRRASRSRATRSNVSRSNSRILRAVLLSFALLTVSVAFIACGSGPSATPVVVEVEKIVEVEKPLAEPKTLTVYSGRSKSLVGPILEEFELLTGIPIEVRYASTGEMAATLLEEGDKSPADVFFAQEPGGLGAVKSLFMTLSDDIFDRSAAWASDPDQKWVGISGRARVIVYSTENISEDELPESIWGFTDPKWKGRIGLSANQRFVPRDGHRHEIGLGRREDPSVARRHHGQRTDLLRQEHANRRRRRCW